MRLVFPLVLAWCCSTSLHALAQTDPDESLQRGLAAAEAGDHWRAIELLQRGRSAVPNEQLDLVLAESFIEVDRWNEADLILDRLASDPDVHPLVAEVAAEHLAALRAQAGVLEVRVDPRPAHTVLVVDGVPWGPSPARATMRVAPGSHVIAVATDDGEILASSTIEIAEQAHRALELRPRLRAPQLAMEPAAAPTALRTEGIDPWPWVGLGAGLAAAIAVVVALVVVFTAPSPPVGDLPTVRIGGGT